MNDPFESDLECFVQAALGKKAGGLTVLDVRQLTSVADAFIICSGRSSRQVTAIGEFIVRDLKKTGVRALGVEGLKDGQWVLIDYGYVVIHIFYEPIRQFYDLEGLWSDARRIQTDSMKHVSNQIAETEADEDD